MSVIPYSLNPMGLKSGIRFKALTDSALTVGYTVYGVDWSSNNRYLSVFGSSTNYVVFDWITGSPIALPPFDVPMTTGNATLYNSTRWSPNSRYLAFRIEVGIPPLSIYDWQSGVPIKVGNPDIVAPNGIGLSWHPSSNYITLGSNNYLGARTYNISTGTPVYMSGHPYSLTSGSRNGNTAAFSTDGTKISLGTSSSPFIENYNWNNGNVQPKMSDPAILPNSAVPSIIWSNNSRYQCLITGASPKIIIYDWVSGSPVFVSTLDTTGLEFAYVYGIAWSPDDRFLIITSNLGPYIIVYEWINGVPIRLSSNIFNALPTTTTISVSWRSDNKYIAIGYMNGMTIYEVKY